MRNVTRFIASLSMLALAATGFSAHAANASGCTPTLVLKVKYTAAGSCKDPSHGWNIHCGTTGVLAASLFSIHLNVTDANGVAIPDPSADPTHFDPSKVDGFQAEACGDTGNGDTQGRLLLQGSQKNQGIRAILDSDPDQAFPAGYDIVELSSAAQGIFCLNKNGTGDGYQASWASPGPVNGLTCIQNLAPGNASTGPMFDAAAAALVQRMPQFAAQLAQLRAMLVH
jgi:hypothetical protein